MDAEVILYVDDNGDVKNVTRRDTGEALRYDVVQASADPAALHEAVSTECLHKELTPALRTSLNSCIANGGAAKVVPLPHCFYDGRTARGAVHVLRGKTKPCESGWPLDLRYASGVTIVEIERTLPNSTYASIEMFKSVEFSRRMQAAIRELHEEVGVAPGLVSPGHPVLDFLKTATSPSAPDDPLLRTFRPNFLSGWRPCLKEEDFIQVYYSTWDTVNASTRALSGHGLQDVHFYFLLCWHLPEEMAEQLLQIARMNPEGQSWAQIAARKEFERALDISIRAREDILLRFMNRVALEPKKSIRTKFVHTTTDILVPDVSVTLPGKERPTGKCVAFYSHCAPTHLQAGGVVSLKENSQNEAAIWWHGKHTADHPGGESWEMPGAVHAMPALGPSLKFSKRTVAQLEAAGCAVGTNGYARLVPIT